LDQDRFDVRLNLKTVLEYGSENRELWNHLDAKDLKKIESVIIPLIKPAKGENDLSRFYDKIIYSLMLKRLETTDSELFQKTCLSPISNVANISKKLLKKMTIPMVKAQEDVIKMTLDRDFWKIEGVHHLDKIRIGIRDLMKFIDKTDQRIVTTNFEDELDLTKTKYSGYKSDREEGNDKVKDATSPFTNNLHRLEEIIRGNRNNITVARIRNGEQITKAELESLEGFLFQNKLDRNLIEEELGEKLDLSQLIVELVGLSPDLVDKAFANFINHYQLSSKQISFLDTIKKFMTTNGKIDPEKLYERPFVDIHPMAVEGVFSEQQTIQIIEIIDHLNHRDIG